MQGDQRKVVGNLDARQPCGTQDACGDGEGRRKYSCDLRVVPEDAIRRGGAGRRVKPNTLDEKSR